MGRVGQDAPCRRSGWLATEAQEGMMADGRMAVGRRHGPRARSSWCTQQWATMRSSQPALVTRSAHNSNLWSATQFQRSPSRGRVLGFVGPDARGPRPARTLSARPRVRRCVEHGGAGDAAGTPGSRRNSWRALSPLVSMTLPPSPRGETSRGSEMNQMVRAPDRRGAKPPGAFLLFCTPQLHSVEWPETTAVHRVSQSEGNRRPKTRSLAGDWHQRTAA